MTDFYVYEHWRPDTGICFYVGKGRGKRAWDMKMMRNRHHMAITSKLTSMGFCVDVRIICKNMSEEDAFKLEIERISIYGIDNLSNMTLGGDGLRSPSKEVREKMSKSQKERFSRPEEIIKIKFRNKNRIASVETRKKLSIASTGRKHSLFTIEKMKKAAKIRGISKFTRDAQRIAVTGKKRAPFSEETIRKMSDAAKIREHRKRLARAI